MDGHLLRRLGKAIARQINEPFFGQEDPWSMVAHLGVGEETQIQNHIMNGIIL